MFKFNKWEQPVIAQMNKIKEEKSRRNLLTLKIHR